MAEIKVLSVNHAGTRPAESSEVLQQILNIKSEIGVAAAIEAQRLAEKHGKDFLDCEDLVKIMGVGKNNIRQLMCSEGFPTLEIGNRRVVSVIAFSLWLLRKGDAV